MLNPNPSTKIRARVCTVNKDGELIYYNLTNVGFVWVSTRVLEDFFHGEMAPELSSFPQLCCPFQILRLVVQMGVGHGGQKVDHKYTHAQIQMPHVLV